jgi:aspartokinase
VLCLAVHDADLKRTKAKLEKAFELEIILDHSAAVAIMPHVAIVVAIGENMKGTPGISGRDFG